MNILFKLPAIIVIVVLVIYTYKKHGLKRALLFPAVLILVAGINYFVKNYWITWLIGTGVLIFAFMFGTRTNRICFSMFYTIKKKDFNKAIDIGEKALANGETLNAIKFNLITAYYKNNNYSDSRRILDSIREDGISSTDKKILKICKQMLSESITEKNKNI